MLELKSLEEAIEYKAPPQAQIAIIGSAMKTPGSDRLHSFTLRGMDWTVISSNVNQTEEDFGTSRYLEGDRVVYIALDSILDPKLEAILFPEGSKVKLEGGRVRTLKLRGAYSQGMIADLKELEQYYPGISDAKVEEDVSGRLNIIKFEPPASSIPGAMKGGQLSKKNKLFKEYLDIRNIKFYTQSGVFEEGEQVFITSKLHGTSVRFGMLPTFVAPVDFSSLQGFWRTFKKQVLNKFGRLPKFEYCLGSRRCQLQDKPDDYATFYESNVYRIVSDQFKIKEKLQPGEILFGEIVGQGIQKDYDYSFKEKSPFGRYGFFAYDVMVNGRFLPAKEFLAWCNDRGLTPVPVLGFLPYNLEEIYKLAGAKKCLNDQKIREGVVVKSVDEIPHPACGRRVFKVINPEYLMKDNTDFH